MDYAHIMPNLGAIWIGRASPQTLNLVNNDVDGLSAQTIPPGADDELNNRPGCRHAPITQATVPLGGKPVITRCP